MISNDERVAKEELVKVIRHFGSQGALAKVLKVSQMAVNHWLNRHTGIPVSAALKITQITKGLFSYRRLLANKEKYLDQLDGAIFFEGFPSVLVPINNIKINGICCRKYTDKMIESSLFEATNLLSSLPILIDTQNNLITCECCIRFQRFLSEKNILVHKVDLKKVIQGSIDIKKLLGKLPISERVMFGIAVQREIGNQQGKRKDLELVGKCPQVPHKTKTREFIAELSGFRNDTAYRRAKFVLEKGTRQVIHLMDEEVCSISRAHHLALLPELKQVKVIKSVRMRQKSNCLADVS